MRTLERQLMTNSAYEAGRKTSTLRTLHRMACDVGTELAIDVVPVLSRKSRRSLGIHRAIDDVLLSDSEPVLNKARANLRRLLVQHPEADDLLAEWGSVLRRDIVEIMLDKRMRARELRQVTPFAGVLSPSQRAAVFVNFREQEELR